MISSLTEVIMNAPKAVLWRDLQNWPFSIHQYNYCSQTKQQWSVPKTLYLTVANGNISVLKWRCWSVITFPVILNKKNSSRCFQSIIKIHIYNLVQNKVMLHQFVSHLSNGSDTCMCWFWLLFTFFKAFWKEELFICTIPFIIRYPMTFPSIRIRSHNIPIW